MKRISNILIKRRIKFLFYFFSLFICIMIARLAYVQFVIGDEISEKAADLWLRDISFQPDRGNILDRNGKEITQNVTATSVIIVPQQIKNKEFVSQKLAEILKIPLNRAEAYVSKKASSIRIHPEGRKISREQEAQLRDLQLEGVYLAKDSKRHYPHDELLAHIIGFTGIDNQGLTGLELQYDEYLKGKPGSFSYYSDAKGRKIANLANMYHPPRDGYHLKTTIDLGIQTIVERELTQAERQYNPDGALAIVVDPSTGEIIAMASRPTFHPEKYQLVDPSVYNRNLPIWSTFEPGSTFKIITLAAALEEKVIDLEHDTFFDKGHIHVGGARLRCWKKGGHGSQTMLEVVQNSCNPGFVHIGSLLGKKRLFTYIKQFGFGEKTGVDLQGEGTGILFNEANVGPVELATTSFGQGVSVTPIQQVMAVSAAINGGYLYEPYIAKEWIDPDTNEVVQVTKPKLKRRVISEETSKQIRDALEHVVAKGTGRPAYIEGYRVGGKTGTAQKVGADGRYMSNNHIVSFIGFAPADDPKYVVYVAIDNPKNTIQFGGVVAAPIVKNILHNSLRMKNIPLRDTGIEKAYQWPEEPLVKVPNLIGMHKQELLTDYSNFQIEMYGEGDVIIDQIPEPGVALRSGATIKVYVREK